MMRITVDLDTKDFGELQETIRAGLDLGLGVPGKIEKTRKGYHIVWRNKDLSFDEALAFRVILGDDEMRVFFDLTTVPRQVLFKRKRVKKVKGRWFDEEI